MKAFALLLICSLAVSQCYYKNGKDIKKFNVTLDSSKPSHTVNIKVNPNDEEFLVEFTSRSGTGYVWKQTVSNDITCKKIEELEVRQYEEQEIAAFLADERTTRKPRGGPQKTVFSCLVKAALHFSRFELARPWINSEVSNNNTVVDLYITSS